MSRKQWVVIAFLTIGNCVVVLAMVVVVVLPMLQTLAGGAASEGIESVSTPSSIPTETEIPTWTPRLTPTPQPELDQVSPSATPNGTLPSLETTGIPTPESTLPMIETPTPTFSAAIFTVGETRLRIVSVRLGVTGDHVVVPAGLGEDETMLTVETEVLSGDSEVVSDARGEYEVWTTDGTGSQNGSRVACSRRFIGGESLIWFFRVPVDEDVFYMQFQSGVTVDLTPFFD